jgi:hypothetical protein
MTFEVVTDGSGSEKVLSGFDSETEARDAMRALQLERGATAWIWDTDRQRVVDSRDSSSNPD